MTREEFAAIKAAVPYEKAAPFLGIELKKDGDKYRCTCPVCDKPRVLIITPSKGVWYCHNSKSSGDVIGLTAYVKGMKQIPAAQLLQETFLREPEKPKPKKRLKRPGNVAKHTVQVSVQVGAQVASVGGTDMDEWEAFIL